MKLFKVLFLSLLAAFLITSCASTPDKVLPKKDGVWDVTTARTLTYVNGSLESDSTETDLGTLTFKSDNTGTVVADGSTSNITWEYDDTNEVMRLTDDNGTTEFDVLESSAKQQTWSTELEFSFFGVTTRTESTWTIDRQ